MIIYIFNKIKDRQETTLQMIQKATRAFLYDIGYNPKKDQKIIIERTKHGKPYFRDIPVHFSLSHSGDICVMAFSKKNVGIDIEKVRDINQDRISNRFFTPEEVEYLNESKTIEDFFRIWTRKEAYSKLVGDPVIRIMQRINTIEGNNLQGQIRNITFKEVQIERGYICTIASSIEGEEVNYEKM